MGLEGKWKSELYKKEVWAETPETTFEEVILHYLNTRPNTQSENAKAFNLYRAKTLRVYYGGLLMNKLSAREVLSHRNKRMKEVKNSTVNRELKMLSAAITAYNLDYETQLPNPIKGRILKEPEGRTRWITKAESVALIEAARKNDQAQHLPDLIILALNTGMRKQEMLGLEWRRVDFQNNLIHLEAQHTKAARRRTIPINNNAKSAILSRMNYRAKNCPASPWVFAHEDGGRILDVRRSFKTACRGCGIEDFRFHDMRHTCAAWLVSSGRDLQEVRDLLGHASITMTERYAHLAPENVRAAVAVLDDVILRKSASQSRFGHVNEK